MTLLDLTGAGRGSSGKLNYRLSRLDFVQMKQDNASHVLGDYHLWHIGQHGHLAARSRPRLPTRKHTQRHSSPTAASPQCTPPAARRRPGETTPETQRRLQQRKWRMSAMPTRHVGQAETGTAALCQGLRLVMARGATCVHDPTDAEAASMKPIQDSSADSTS